jgi:hypothetical protein
VVLRLKVGDYEVPEHNLTYVVLSIGSIPVSFGGTAREEEGKGIERTLRRLAEDKAIPYEVIDMRGIRLTGLCNIINLKFDTSAEKAPALIRFSGQLEVVV